MRLTSKNISNLLLIILSCYISLLLVVGLWPMNFRQHNKAVLDNHNGIKLIPPSIAYSQIPPQKLLNIREFTILIDMGSDFSASEGFGSILTYGLDYYRMNFMVGQWRSGIELRIKSDSNTRTISFGKKNVFRKGEQARFAVVYDLNKLILYHNGEKIAARRTGPLTFSRWERTYPLVIGSNAEGRSFWKGTIRSIAIIDRALLKSEIQTAAVQIREFLPLIYYSFENDEDMVVTDYGTGTPATLIVPNRFIPYGRAVLEFSLNGHNKFLNNLLDITINLLGFIPLGFFLFMYMTQRHASLMRSLLFSIVIGFTVSFFIEISQAFLWSRSSSMLDLINNTLGSAIGAFLYYHRGHFLKYCYKI